MGNGIAFRRINGHVVPIRMSSTGVGNSNSSKQATGAQQNGVAPKATARGAQKVKPKTFVEKNSLGRKAAGAGLIAGGLGIAVAAGNKAHQLVRKSGDVEAVARVRQATQTGQMSLFKNKGTQKLFNLSSKLHGARNLSLIAGALAGGVAIEAGRKLFSKDHETTKDTLATSTGAASTIAGLKYYNKLNPGLKNLKSAYELARSRTVGKSAKYFLKGM